MGFFVELSGSERLGPWNQCDSLKCHYEPSGVALVKHDQAFGYAENQCCWIWALREYYQDALAQHNRRLDAEPGYTYNRWAGASLEGWSCPEFTHQTVHLMPITVGRVPYLHTEPFYFDMPRRGIQLRDLMPSAMAPAAEAGEIDAGLVPVVDAFKLEGRFQPIVGFCIACNDSSGSVFLYSTKPIEELAGARVGVTDEAVTAPKLLEVLLKLKYGVSPGEYVPLQPQEYEAFLLIGNRALRQRRGARGFPHRYDLGQEWNSWTGLPFVFSRWIARINMDSRDLALLEDTLYVGLEDGVDALYHLNEPKDELLMLPRDVVNHLQGVRYFMGLSEQKGLNTFREYLKQLES